MRTPSINVRPFVAKSRVRLLLPLSCKKAFSVSHCSWLKESLREEWCNKVKINEFLLKYPFRGGRKKNSLILPSRRCTRQAVCVRSGGKRRCMCHKHILTLASCPKRERAILYEILDAALYSNEKLVTQAWRMREKGWLMRMQANDRQFPNYPIAPSSSISLPSCLSCTFFVLLSHSFDLKGDTRRCHDDEWGWSAKRFFQKGFHATIYMLSLLASAKFLPLLLHLPLTAHCRLWLLLRSYSYANLAAAVREKARRPFSVSAVTQIETETSHVWCFVLLALLPPAVLFLLFFPDFYFGC